MRDFLTSKTVWAAVVGLFVVANQQFGWIQFSPEDGERLVEALVFVMGLCLRRAVQKAGG